MKRHRGDRRPKYLVYKIDANLADQLGLDDIAGDRLNMMINSNGINSSRDNLDNKKNNNIINESG